MKLIDADKLNYVQVMGCGQVVLKSDILRMPTIDVEPIKHGHWIVPSDSSTIACICSNCDWESHYYEDDVNGMPYCPNCGAKMDKEEENE